MVVEFVKALKTQLPRYDLEELIQRELRRLVLVVILQPDFVYHLVREGAVLAEEERNVRAPLYEFWVNGIAE